MLNVSSDLINAATLSGREISARISAAYYSDNGSTLNEIAFGDLEILDFEFDDIVGEEGFELGSAFPNKFTIRLKTDKSIPLDAVVKPFISFFPCGEEVALGEFYVMRRFRSKDCYTVTCYDKMYDLNADYQSELSFPANIYDVLGEICLDFGFIHNFPRNDSIVATKPDGVSYRDVIGYIAGIYGGCAKFSRDGILKLRKMEKCDFVINPASYMKLTVKSDVSVVNKVSFTIGDTIFTAGNGPELTALTQENPFATQAAADSVYQLWKNYSYQGLELQMQGLPFLEAGDSIDVIDDCDGKPHNAIISGISYKYNGGFSAVLFSRSRNPLDIYNGETQYLIDKAAAELRRQLAFKITPFVNENLITLNSASKKIIDIAFEVSKDTAALFNAALTGTATADGVLNIRYYLNGTPLTLTPSQTVAANDSFSTTLYYTIAPALQGVNVFEVYAKVTSGNFYIAPYQISASVSGQSFLGNSTFVRPDLSLSQTLDYSYVRQQVKSRTITDNLSARFDILQKCVFVDRFEKIKIGFLCGF